MDDDSEWTHSVGLVDEELAVRNKAGRPLRSVPAALKDDPAVVGTGSSWRMSHLLCHSKAWDETFGGTALRGVIESARLMRCT